MWTVSESVVEAQPPSLLCLMAASRIHGDLIIIHANSFESAKGSPGRQ